MQALLTRIGIERETVAVLGEASGRERLLSEALRPAAATDMWRARMVDADFVPPCRRRSSKALS